MEISTLQSLLDSLGPAWRVFYNDPSSEASEPLEVGLVARAEFEPPVHGHEGEDVATLVLRVHNDFQTRFVRVAEPEVVLSDEQGHLLRFRRPDPEGGWQPEALELSTRTLTAAHRAELARSDR